MKSNKFILLAFIFLYSLALQAQNKENDTLNQSKAKNIVLSGGITFAPIIPNVGLIVRGYSKIHRDEFFARYGPSITFGKTVKKSQKKSRIFYGRYALIPHRGANDTLFWGNNPYYGKQYDFRGQKHLISEGLNWVTILCRKDATVAPYIVYGPELIFMLMNKKSNKALYKGDQYEYYEMINWSGWRMALRGTIGTGLRYKLKQGSSLFAQLDTQLPFVDYNSSNGLDFLPFIFNDFYSVVNLQVGAVFSINK